MTLSHYLNTQQVVIPTYKLLRRSIEQLMIEHRDYVAGAADSMLLIRALSRGFAIPPGYFVSDRRHVVKGAIKS